MEASGIREIGEIWGNWNEVDACGVISVIFRQSFSFCTNFYSDLLYVTACVFLLIC